MNQRSLLALCTILSFLILTTSLANAQELIPDFSKLPSHAYQHKNLVIVQRETASRNITLLEKQIRLKLASSFRKRIALELYPTFTSVTGLRATDNSNLQKYLNLNLKSPIVAKKIKNILQQIDSVHYSYYAFAPAPPPAELTYTTTPLFRKKQRYAGAARTALNFNKARKIPGARGQNVQIFDMEFGWINKHEDLPIRARDITNKNTKLYYREHGTAVAGILVAKNNAIGMRGLVDRAKVYLTPPHDTTGAYNPAFAIYQATELSKVGDVLLIEQQLFGPLDSECVCTTGCSNYVPVEYDPASFAAIQYAVSQGRIVVEAAGNGGINLDGSNFNNWFNPAIQNSNAIMISAVRPNDLTGECFSNRGQRADLSAWGSRVATTGYGDLFPANLGTDKKRNYTAFFSGTSSASAIISGAVAALQGVATMRTGIPLSSNAILSILQQTGTAVPTANFGPQPNVEAAISQYLNQ